MAVIWDQKIGSNYYEVRSAGATLRLYRNGAHHSQWNPNRPLSGCIWDLIVLPALFRRKRSIKDVLMLGFGAGAVARKLQTLVEPETIVGIESDPVHLNIANKFFGCSDGCKLFAADAIEWVRKASAKANPAKYDLIIDDLFAEKGSSAVRCVSPNIEWCKQLAKQVKPDGLLVLNLEFHNVVNLPLLTNPELMQQFPYSIGLLVKGYGNLIVAFSERSFDRSLFEANFTSSCKIHPQCKHVVERYLEFDPKEICKK